MFDSVAISFDDDHEAFRASVRDFLAREVSPNYGEWRGSQGIPGELFEAAGQYGFLGFGAPERFGGAGIDDSRFTVVLVDECTREGFIGLAVVLAIHVGVCIPHLVRFGDAQQQAHWLPQLTSGKRVAAVADAAPAAELSVLRGGPGTGLATLLMSPRPTTGGVLLIDAGNARTVVDTRAFLGVEEAPGVEVSVRDDESGDGLQGAEQLSAAVDAWCAVVHAGASRHALDLAAQYAGERKVFGRPLASFENTRSVVGAAVANTIAITDLAYSAAITRESDGPRAAAARLVASAVHRHNADIGLQIHGGYGYMREYPIAQCYADAAVLTTTSMSGGRVEQLLAEHVGL